MELGRRVVQRMIRLQLSSAFSGLRAAVSRCQQHRHTVERAIGRWRAPAVSDCFSRWVDAISDARARCSVLQRVVTRMQNRLLTVAFERFASFVISAQKKRDMCGQFADAVSTSGTKYANRKCYFAVWSCHVESLRLASQRDTEANRRSVGTALKSWKGHAHTIALDVGRLARRIRVSHAARCASKCLSAWARWHLRFKLACVQLLDGKARGMVGSPGSSRNGSGFGLGIHSGGSNGIGVATEESTAMWAFSLWRLYVEKCVRSQMQVGATFVS